jgi:formylglycine-generating enzyme required for sulfatase activity
MRCITGLVALLGWTLSCSSASNTVVLIDTDLPSPEIASSLRIDVYSASGTKIDTRDVDLSGPNVLPVSFGLARSEDTRLRLRVFPKSRTIAESGEPDPALAIDRLVLIPGGRSAESFGVLLKGECAGVPAVLDAGVSCIDSKRRASKIATPAENVAKTASNSLRDPCAANESDEARVCIPGGVFIMGDRNERIEEDPDVFFGFARERLAHVSKFFIDRNEITVARYRSAIRAGFSPTRYSAKDNNAPLGMDPLSSSACTFSKSPMGREGYGLNCLPYMQFQELCVFLGGSLPTEAQWEYVATAAGGTEERIYPYGNEPPTCDQIVHARGISPGCKTLPKFPPVLSETGASLQMADQTPLGVLGMGGGLSEFVFDPPRDYADACWNQALFHDTRCDLPQPAADSSATDFQVSTRGSSWAGPAHLVQGAARARSSITNPFVGARCVYKAR